MYHYLAFMSENQEIEKRLNELTKQVEKLTKYFEQPDELAQDEVVYEEGINPFDVVQFANYALSTLTLIDETDTELTDTGKRAILRIRRKGLKLLDYGTNLFYEDIFGEDNSNNQNN